MKAVHLLHHEEDALRAIDITDENFEQIQNEKFGVLLSRPPTSPGPMSGNRIHELSGPSTRKTQGTPSMRLLRQSVLLFMGLTFTGVVAPISGQDIPTPSKRPDKKQRDKGRLPRIHLEGILGKDRSDSEQILREASIIHALPERRVRAHPQTYRYLLDRLDIAGQLVKKWRLGRYRITREGEATFQVDDRRGAIAQLREIQTLRTEKGWSRIYLARGYFKIPMIPGPRIDGKGLILLEYESDGLNQLNTRAWVLFRIDNKILNHLSKMARKILQQVIGKKCQLFVLAAAEVSEKIAKDPQKAYKTLQSIDGITPQAIKDFQTAILDRK